MKRRIPIGGLAFVLVLATSCASAGKTPAAAPGPELSPADLVASLADVANGRNEAMAETGLVLKTIELRLLVGRENRAGGRVSFLVLDAEASRRSEVSFTQSFTLELPAPRRPRSAAAAPTVPGVVEFVEAALAAARELAAAAAREGLPQKLSEVELSARIVRSARIQGGLAFTAIAGPGLSADAGRADEESNTVRLVFGVR
ncbi:MAG TPA: hypothetical protein VNC59_08820 [Thermoanaerobaculia bacterium]|nr:hypothetical protein [Thermoanaerobaculia bacterium]